jgi:hypothetical protein
MSKNMVMLRFERRLPWSVFVLVIGCIAWALALCVLLPWSIDAF